MLLKSGQWLFDIGDVAVYKDGSQEVIRDREWGTAWVLEVKINDRSYDRDGWSPENPIVQIITRGEMLV